MFRHGLPVSACPASASHGAGSSPVRLFPHGPGPVTVARRPAPGGRAGRRGSAEQIYFQRVQSGVPGEHSYRPVGSGLDCSFLGVQFDGGVAD